MITILGILIGLVLIGWGLGVDHDLRRWGACAYDHSLDARNAWTSTGWDIGRWRVFGVDRGWPHPFEFRYPALWIPRNPVGTNGAVYGKAVDVALFVPLTPFGIGVRRQRG